jgi:NAD(P)H-flavin reductase
VALIPSDVKQVVLLVSGVTGMAPMLQMIHTLLEARRGDGVEEKI